MIEFPTTDGLRCLTRHNVAAVFIVTSSNPSPVIVATAADIRRSLSWWASASRSTAPLFRDSAPNVDWAMWCDRVAASRIVQAVTGRERGGVVQMEVEGAATVIRSAAIRHRVPLADHGATMDKVAAQVAAIANHVDDVNSNGGLGPFNRAYKAYRMGKVAAGGRAIPYGTALARLRRAVGEHTAAARGGVVAPDILARVFGD